MWQTVDGYDAGVVSSSGAVSTCGTRICCPASISSPCTFTTARQLSWHMHNQGDAVGACAPAGREL